MAVVVMAKREAKAQAHAAAKARARVRQDEIITQVQYGQMKPEQAEAKAKANGWLPFQRQPQLPAFDPMQESRWSIVMAIAWIAWRDLTLTREQWAEFRAECTHWVFLDRNEPIEGGAAFARQSGWILEQWRRRSTIGLCLVERYDTVMDDLPASRQKSIAEAEKELWQFLSDGRLTAEAFDQHQGKPVDIPRRDWSYLKLFEEHERDALKYDALGEEPYTRIKLKRDDLLKLWPPIAATVNVEQNCRRWLIEQMRESKTVKRFTKAFFKEAAKKKFPTLSGRQFLRAWNDAIEASGATAWKRPGRPSASKTNLRTGSHQIVSKRQKAISD